MVICLVRGADLHMAQLIPLPLTVCCCSKIQIGFTFLVPAHPGSPGQRAIKRVCVCVCANIVCGQVQEGVDYLLFNLLILGSITDREGYVWTRSPADLYVIETMPLMQRENSRTAVCYIVFVLDSIWQCY